jgi:hypothetical protein
LKIYTTVLAGRSFAKPKNQRKLFPLLGERIKGEGGRNTYSNENVDGVAATRLYAVFICG